VFDDVIKEKIEAVSTSILLKFPPEANSEGEGGAAGAGSAEEAGGAAEEGEYVEEDLGLDSSVEKDSYLKTPDNMERSAGISPDVNVKLFKVK
jgi:hypothetical protein